MKPPKLLSDLYSDLRDKRLLPVVILLLAGIVAVPVALSATGGTEAEPSAGGAIEEVDLAPPVEADPVVLADVPGIRDFRKRLKSFESENPFRQRFTAPLGGQQEQGLQSLKGAGEGSGGGTSGSGTTTDSETAAPATVDGGSGATTTTGEDGGEDSGTGGGGSGKKKGGGKEIVFFSWRIDVNVRVDGETTSEKDLKPLEFVPGKKRPILQFLQGNPAATEAVFVVSRRVESNRGVGKCAPSRAECEFLLLKEGQGRRFVYEPDGRTYLITLKDVRVVEERVDAKKASPEALLEQTSAYGELLSLIRG